MDRSSAGYLYVPCVRSPDHSYAAQTNSWVREVQIVRKTAKLIYYASDSWDRHEAIVSPGCISREQFETDTRCHPGQEHCLHSEDPCHHGYPAGVIAVPGRRPHADRPGWLFFATREAAEDDLYRWKAGGAAREVPPVKKLRHAMADAHPDRGGTTEQFIEARRQYEMALQAA